MKFSILQENLIKPLQQVAGVVERRQTLPVLSNVLMVAEGNSLAITGTNLEVELVVRLELEQLETAGEITVPAKKILDICKSLPGDAIINFELVDNKIVVKAGRSRFVLASLPASDFPNLEDTAITHEFIINQGYLKDTIERTSFAMALQDVRFYLNGMLLELSQNKLKTVATDGHRLALSDAEVQFDTDTPIQVIVPRKGILELPRLFSDVDSDVKIALSANHIRAETSSLCFTSKLVDGKFPDYEKVVPRQTDKLVIGNKDDMKKAFSRVAILSNEKYRGVRVKLQPDSLTLVANNPEQEEASEVIGVAYNGPELEIGFNVSYLLDVMSVIVSDTLHIMLADSNTSALIVDANDDTAQYVVMPMRL